MTQTQTPPGPNDPYLLSPLKDVKCPPHAVVVIDDALPEPILEHFPNAVRVQAGESLKTFSALEAVAQKILEQRSSKPLTLIAVGGGSVGDAIGFLASILWRGVELWHIPTTLLAMVDSAHGGKTAVNLGKAKNQLGTFYPASKVFIVPEILETLPLAQRVEGLAELVKAFWLGDAKALDIWMSDAGRFASAPFEEIGDTLIDLLMHAIAVKYDVVSKDPFETKEIRTFLNLGHTVAHALELELGMSHGNAVSWGLACAAVLSQKHGFSPLNARRMFESVYPLLVPLAADALPTLERFSELVSKDKKRRNNELRSVLLKDVAQPYVTTCSPEEWHSALLEAQNKWAQTPIRVQLTTAREATIDLAASKSEQNRALCIQHLWPEVQITSPGSDADDVRHLRAALVGLRDERAKVFAGEGGTTLRFLLAQCAAHTRSVSIEAQPALMKRPHSALINALQRAGATIETTVRGYRVAPWGQFPEEITLEPAPSSQPASAIALLAASGMPFRLSLDLKELPSRGYFDMTLNMLRASGIELELDEMGVRFLGRTVPGSIHVNADASSASIFAAMPSVNFQSSNLGTLQPDASAPDVMARADAGEVSAADTPDMVPVLLARACVRGVPLRVTDGEILAHKESNRIDDLATLLRDAGATVETTATTIEVTDFEPALDALLDPKNDHRLAFAAAVLSERGVFRIANPWVVTKSYPRFWHDLRKLGWHIEPVQT